MELGPCFLHTVKKSNLKFLIVFLSREHILERMSVHADYLSKFILEMILNSNKILNLIFLHEKNLLKSIS